MEDSAAARVALAFTSVHGMGTPQESAAECLAAARNLLGAEVRLVVPTAPVPLSIGAPVDGLASAARFPAADGVGELWVATDVHVPETVQLALEDQLARVWAAQRERTARVAELDRLRFQLTSLQQVARTLAMVRGVEEMERLALDSVGEVFFAWWAALYRTEGDEYTCRASRSARGEAVAPAIPAAEVLELSLSEGVPRVPGADARVHARFPSLVQAVAPLDLGDAGAGLLVLGPRMTDAAYDAHDLALLRALSDSTAVALRNADLLDRLRAQAILDPLTGCQNRRGFDQRLASEIARSRRYGRPLTLILLDIDHFKRINDEIGHDGGDEALRRAGAALRSAVRATDTACRYGGEEFALILPETPKPEGALLAERLRALIETLPPDGTLFRPMTASIGVAAFAVDALQPADLVRAADQALYRAKSGGRNRVEVA